MLLVPWGSSAAVPCETQAQSSCLRFYTGALAKLSERVMKYAVITSLKVELTSSCFLVSNLQFCR